MRVMYPVFGSFIALTALGCGSSSSVAPTPPPTEVAPAPDPVVEEPMALGDGYKKVAPSPAPAVTPVAGACISSEGPLNAITFEGRALVLCGGAYGKPACWKLDLDQAKLSPEKRIWQTALIAPNPSFFRPAGLKVTRDMKSIESCIDPKACVKLDIEGSMVGDADVHKGRVLVTPPRDTDDPAAANPAARVFDGKTGKLLAKLPYADLGSDCPQFSWAGELVYAEIGVCAGPGAIGAFYDATSGQRVGWLGGEENVSAYGVRPIELPSGLVAFRHQYGHAIYFHDGKTGALVKTMNLDDTLVKVDGEPATDPEEGTMRMTKAADGAVELVIVNGGESRRHVVVVDPVAASVKRVLELTVCPPE